MSAIDDLWDDGKLPIRDALHFSGGSSYDVVRDPYVLGCLGVREAFDLPGMLAEAPTWLSSIGGLIEEPLKSGDFLWGGEGSHGSDGFFARVRPDETLVWAVFFMDSNPFEVGIELFGKYAKFHSSAEIAFTVDIDDPRLPVAPHRQHR
jgi:hypothetical protein